MIKVTEDRHQRNTGSKYRNELIYAGTTAGMIGLGVATWNADEIQDFLSGVL